MKVFLNIFVVITFILSLAPVASGSDQGYQALIKEYKAAVASKNPARIKAAQKRLNASKGAVKYMKKHNPNLHKKFVTKAKSPAKARLAKIPEVTVERVGGGKLLAGSLERGDAVQIKLGKKQEVILHPDGKVSTSKPARAPRPGESVGNVPVEYTTKDIPGGSPDSSFGKGSSSGRSGKSNISRSGKGSSSGGSSASRPKSKAIAPQDVRSGSRSGSSAQRAPSVEKGAQPSPEGFAKSKSMRTGPEPVKTKIGKAPKINSPVGDPELAELAKPERLSIQEIMARQNKNTPESVAEKLDVPRSVVERDGPRSRTKPVSGDPALADLADPANKHVGKNKGGSGPDLSELGKGERVRTSQTGEPAPVNPETRVRPGNSNTRVTGEGRVEPGSKTRVSSGNTPTEMAPVNPETRVRPGNSNTRVTGEGRVEPGSKTRVSSGNTPTEAGPVNPETRVRPGNSNTRVTGEGRVEPGSKTRVSSGNTPTEMAPVNPETRVRPGNSNTRVTGEGRVEPGARTRISSGNTPTRVTPGATSNPSLVDGKGRASSSYVGSEQSIAGKGMSAGMTALGATMTAGGVSSGVQKEREAAANAGRDVDVVRAGAQVARTFAGGDIADASARIAREERQKEFDQAQAEGREPDYVLAADKATSRVASEVLNPVAAGEGMGDRIGKEEALIEIERARAAGETPSATRATVQSGRRIVGEVTGIQAIYDNALYDSDADRQAAETGRRLEGKRQDAILEMDNGMFDLGEIERKQRALETNKCLQAGNTCDQESRDWAQERRTTLQTERDALRDRLQGINNRLGPDAGAGDPEAIAIRQAVQGIDEPVGGTDESVGGTGEPESTAGKTDGETDEECLTVECLGKQGDKDIGNIADILNERMDRDKREREGKAQQGETEGETGTGEQMDGTGETVRGAGDGGWRGEDAITAIWEAGLTEAARREREREIAAGTAEAVEGDGEQMAGTGEECGTFRNAYPTDCQNVGVLDMEVGCKRIIEYSCNDGDGSGEPSAGSSGAQDSGEAMGANGGSDQNRGQTNPQVARRPQTPTYNPGRAAPTDDGTGYVPQDDGTIYEPDWERFDPPPPPPPRDLGGLRGAEEETNRMGGGDTPNGQGVQVAMGTNTAGNAMDNVRSRTSGETDSAQRDASAVQDERVSAAQSAHGSEMENINRQGRQAENAVATAREQWGAAESARQSGRVERDQIGGAPGRGGIEGAAALGASTGGTLGAAAGTRASEGMGLVKPPPTADHSDEDGESRDGESGSSGASGANLGCESARNQVSALAAKLNKNPGDSAATSSLQAAQKNMESACSQDGGDQTASGGGGGGRVCTDSRALNYKENGRCVYRGCMDSSASNYNKDAIESGECIYGGSDNSNDDDDDCCGADDSASGGGETHHGGGGGAGITVTSPSPAPAPPVAPAPPPVAPPPPPPPPTSCGCALESQCAPCTGGKGRLFPCYACQCLGGCY